MPRRKAKGAPADAAAIVGQSPKLAPCYCTDDLRGQELLALKRKRDLLVSALVEAGAKVEGDQTNCPFHDDGQASGSIHNGTGDGAYLYTCHACEWNNGQSTGDVIAVLRRSEGIDFSTACTRLRTLAEVTDRDPLPDPDGLGNLIMSIARQVGKKPTEGWSYRYANGQPAFRVVKYEGATGDKTYRPIHWNGDKWIAGDPPGSLPLYRLPEVLAAGVRGEPIYVVEGEKCTDALWRIGLAATTSAHGAKGAKKTDWSPLAGRRLVILPDNDDAGGKYAQDVRQHLAELDPPATVKVRALPHLPPGGDIVDYVAQHPDTDAASLRVEIERLPGTFEVLTQHQEGPRLDMTPSNPEEEVLSVESAYQDLTFPIDALPKALRSFVREAAESISCPPDFIAVPMLTAFGAIIGRTRRIEVKPGWTEPASLWTLIVGDSGTAKTPAMEAALKHVFSILDKSGGTWVNDTTIEALAQLMDEFGRGVLLYRDELSAWIRGFGQYKGGNGSDEPFFLECWSGTRIRVTRKAGAKDDLKQKRFTVTQPFLSIAGGIQPTVLAKLVAADRIESGFAARFLFCYPHRVPRRFSEAVISDEAQKPVAEIFKRLGELEFSTQGDPDLVTFTPEGRSGRSRLLREHQEETYELDPTSPLVPAWSKMEGLAARLMLILHLVRVAADEVDDEHVDATTVKQVEQLLRYFKAHAIRVYSETLGHGRSATTQAAYARSTTTRMPEEHNRPLEDRISRWIQKRGNSGIVPRDLIAARIVANADEANAICEQLVKRGAAFWRAGEGQRVARLFLREKNEELDQPAA